MLTITDDDVAGAFWFSQTAYSASEGSPSALLTVYRSSGAANAEVTWTIVPEGTTALLGPDYTTPGDALTGTLLFGANVGGQTIPITLRRQGDTVADGSRTIKVRLSDPKPAGFASLATQAVTTLTITDNDSAGTLQFTPASVTASEAAGQAVLTVTRSQKASGVTVDWAVMATESTALPNTDYGGPTSGTLAFAADVLSQAIQIPLVDRNGAQGSRTLRVRLSNARGGATLGGQTIATLTITDDEVGVRAAQATSAVNEGYGSAAITILRTGPTAPAVTVNYATGDAGDTATPALTPTVCSAGADYLPIPAGALTFNPGETSKTVLVTLCGDSIEEGAETLTLRLTGVTPNAHLGAPATTVLTIQENDEGGSLQWYSAATSVSEGTPHVALYVLRSGGSAGSVTVDYVIAGGTATAPPAGGADFDWPGPQRQPHGHARLRRQRDVPDAHDPAGQRQRDRAQRGLHRDAPERPGRRHPREPSRRHGHDRRQRPLGHGPVQPSDGHRPRVRPVRPADRHRTGSTSALATVNYQVTGDTTAVVQAALAGTVTFNPGQWSVALDIPLLDDAIRDGNSTLTVTLTPR